ncbi:MAG: hypothetical protein KME23_23755 [Goleter apudmare HA4340-LM2]|jgi:hypothetical protein|nr:hypothetical protein [Goleter apudmare HA4340-LM2]
MPNYLVATPATLLHSSDATLTLGYPLIAFVQFDVGSKVKNKDDKKY